MSQATDPPPLVPGLPGVARLPVLVTGGTGTIGSQVVAELLRSGAPARVLTRMTGQTNTDAQEIEGDLATGSGLDEAVDGVQSVIHCASNAAHAQDVDVDGTERLCNVLAEHNPTARLIHVSIVGCWENPLPYYRAKAAAETVVIGSGRSHVIVRATQVHELVHRLIGGQVAGFGVGLRGLRFAPIESAWLAMQLVDRALEEKPSQASVEYAGPEILTGRELAVLTAHIEGRRAPRVLRLPAVGGTMRRFAEGSNLPGPQAIRGGATYAQWLSDQPA
ncbi:epimerase [Flexivirga endophytica]|uniref:Epimerase n=1 Tax=Flexivirga endophytica TaxID=1849103 RepID=A0A916WXV1_9MICO|nr:NAD(P)H-binding protein [Flexivirga endophytica]GGB39019.1 epimerase [Flexivirga endophytica]GHB46985.1 epimerase [Flexivirga endophytica]